MTKGLDEAEPMVPIAEPFFVSCRHDASVDGAPLSSEKIFEASLLLKRKLRHEVACKGKAEAKVCKKSSSEIAKVLVLAVVRLKVRDAMSAMVLWVPAMETEMSGDASFVWIRMANARVRRPATREREERSLLVQLTVGVLSHQAATCVCRRGATCSSTR